MLSLAVCNDAEGQDRLFTSSADSAIYSWSLPDPRRDPYAPYHDVRARQFALVGHTDAVWSLAAHPYYRNSPLLVSCSADGTAKIWNDLDLAHTLRRPGLEPVSSSWIKVAPARVAVGYDDGSITLWDAFQGKEIQTFQPARAQIDALVSHATMPLLFAGCGDGTVRAIDVNSGEEAWSEELHEGGVTCLDVNPDGLTLASGGELYLQDTTPFVRLPTLSNSEKTNRLRRKLGPHGSFPKNCRRACQHRLRLPRRSHLERRLCQRHGNPWTEADKGIGSRWS